MDKEAYRIIVWLRNDLRTIDNYALEWAKNYKAHYKEILPVFCFDPRTFGDSSETKFMTFKTGSLRCQFILEAV